MAHPLPTPKPTAPKTKAPETTKTETPPKTEMSQVTKQQLDIIKKDGANEEEINGAIKTIRDNAVASLPKNASPDDIAKAVAKELTSVLAQIKPPKDPPNPHLLANSLVSLALGKEILKPKNDNDIKDLATVMNYITMKGVEQPGKCGADLWRTMNRIKVSQGGEQILDGTKISKEEGQKDKEHSMSMQKTLNLFFQHVTKTDTKDWIKDTDIGEDQGGATTLGNNFKTKLTEANLDEGKVKTMQRLFGLGAQELFTRPGDWSIPPNFRKGEGQLSVSEFSGAYSKQMEPLQYSREIAINIRDDGKIEYIVTQPITFKDTGDAEPIGMCRMQSTFTFDENMNCIDMKQDVKQATRAT